MKLISSKVMEAILQSDYGIETDDYVHRYASWIADALEIIEVQGLKIKSVVKLERKGDIVMLPCDIGNIDSLLIRDNCNGVTFLNIVNYRLPCSCYDTCFDSINQATYIDHNKLRTKYKGDIYAAYTTIKADVYGNPMIPDNAFIKEAIGYYIIHKMCMTGYEHKTLNFQSAYQLWEKHYPRASNDINWFNNQEQTEFVNMWTNIYAYMYNANS